MSSAAEGFACATAAAPTGTPVRVSWTPHEDRSGRLRSRETVAEAVAGLRGLPVAGFLASCCPPDSIAAAMADLAAADVADVGGYGNAFTPVPEDWTRDGGAATDGLIGLRDDPDPDAYAVHAARWLDAGATVIGGCCGTRPAHIARLRALIDARP